MRLLLSKITLGILAVLVTAGILLVSVSFLMVGAATGLETVFVAQPWLGWVITGGVFLLIPIIFFKIYFSKTKTVTIDTIDILAWTRKHPYQSTGAAAAAGFIVSGKETSEVLLPLVVEYLQSKQKVG